MKSKRFRIILTLVCVALALSITAASLFAYKNFSIHNIYDEMFYSYAYLPHTGKEKKMEPTVETRFPSDVLSEVRISEDIYSENFLVYNADLLSENETITLLRYPDEKILKFSFRKIYGENWIIVSFVYHVVSTDLVSEPIQIFRRELPYYIPEDDPEAVSDFMRQHGITLGEIVRWRNNLLNEKIVAMWLEYNAETSKYAANNLGKFTCIDNLAENFTATG